MNSPYRNADHRPTDGDDEIPDFRDMRPLANRHGWRAALGTVLDVVRVVLNGYLFVKWGLMRSPVFFAIVPVSVLIAHAYTKLRPVYERRHAIAVEREAKAWLARVG